jgi:TRAP-type uncharacterized transport system substrate-binding protein
VARATDPWFVRHRVPLLAVSGLAGVLLLWFALDLWRPLPSRSFVMAVDAQQGAYAAFGEQYRAVLARDGVTLELRPSAGADQNLDLLRDPTSGVKAAFLLGGTVPDDAAGDLVSLGTIFYEPLWLFTRGETPLGSLPALKGRRLSIGVPGSGSYAVADALLRLNQMQPGDLEVLELPPAESAARLEAGTLDAVFITAAWEEPVVQRLLVAPGIQLESFPRADAYVARYPFLTRLTLPMGVADLAANRPASDVTLIAFKATLVVRRDLHPALQYLLMHAALETHGRAGIFQRAGQFPGAEAMDLPLSNDARQFYQRGPSFLNRHLPFWMAEIVQRVLLMLVPLVGVLYPLWSGLPRLFRWEMQHRIYRLYGELKWIERELQESMDAAQRQALLERLGDLEERVLKMRLPNAFGAMGYNLRMHVRMLREAYAARLPAEEDRPPGAMTSR